MSLEQAFNHLSDIRTFLLRGEGIDVSVSNFGAKIFRLSVPNDRGEWKDIVLGFNAIQDWILYEPYFNAVIGRYANRIKNGTFALDGTVYHLNRNDNNNTLHGGLHGFHEKMWDVEQVSDNAVTFHYFSPDGEENFPANLDVWVTYEVADHALSISFRAHADRLTVVSLTQHAYLNLAGEGNPSVADHLLQIFADYYTPFDDTACPTGVIAPVHNTLLDFRQPVRIGDRMFAPQFDAWRGINENFILSDKAPMKKAAVLSADGRTLTVYTSMPGLQLYTGGYIESHIGKSRQPYGPHCALCLEPQYFPDSPNHPHFPSTRISPQHDFNETIKFVFSH